MSCYNSTVVSAAPEAVWAKLRNFHDASWAPNVISRLDQVGDIPGTQPGARRILNGAFHETLLAIDDLDRVIRYRIDDGPDVVAKDRVQGYIGEVRVFPVTDTGATFVLWTSRWDSSTGDVAAFCNPIYQALLADLKQSFA